MIATSQDEINKAEINRTKRQFLYVVTGEYFITGFFWVFSTLGSALLGESEQDTARAAQGLFFSMFVLMFSNGIWEVLTGWYADKFKRQYSMSAGYMACLVGFILMGVAVLFTGGDPVLSPRALVWNAGLGIWSLGPALLSGAQEAWLVDRCNFFSKQPPEDVDDTFKKSAALGVFFKSLGTGVCFVIFFAGGTNSLAEKPDDAVFIIAALVAAGLSAGLFIITLRLREEYWSHPKYQTNESLFSFMRSAWQELSGRRFRWFTLGYIGIMSINYVLSTTAWPYLAYHADVHKEAPALMLAGVFLAAELAGSLLSVPFSSLIDQIKRRRARIPVASLVYFVPLLLLALDGRSDLVYMLIGAAFLFRVAHASVFGSLNTIGQLAIESDERRALLLSMSSAFSSVLMSVIFFIFFWLSESVSSEIETRIGQFWITVPIVFIAMLALGGCRAARPRTEGR